LTEGAFLYESEKAKVDREKHMNRVRAIKRPKKEDKQLRMVAGVPAFVKGSPKPEGSGRKKGTPNRHSVVLKDCIQRAMEMVGSNRRGKDGAEGYLAHLAWNHPDIFGRLLEKLLPFSLSGAGGGPVQIEYTNREEIMLRFKERGLPVPPNLLAPPRRKPPRDAEIIDAEVEDVE
jgi:hypothetical protein